LGVVVRS
jgi:hypothetical protein